MRPKTQAMRPEPLAPLQQLLRVLATARSRLAAERGSMLVEVMVGTIVLAIATAAVLDGLDGAQKTGRKNKDRSVAATLAQQDVERLRSMPISALANLEQTRNVDVNGVTYAVDSKTVWMRDSTGELSCSDDTDQAQYLKVTSTATAPASADHPVTESTLITPPASFSATSGTATIRATDRLGKPLAGVSIQLSGTSSLTGTTNDLGCAIFSFIPAGPYKAQVPGNLVSWNSVKPANAPLTVNPGRTSPVRMELEQPASLRINFKRPNGTSINWQEATVPHPNLPGGGKVFTRSTPGPSVDATDLFPQLSGYGVYAGSCLANNPERYDPDYYTSSSTRHKNVSPGDSLIPIDAIVPTLTVSVTRQQRQTTRVRIDQSDLDTEDKAECPNVWNMGASIPRTNTSGTTLETKTTSFSVPFGHYRVCIESTVSGGTTKLTSSTTATDAAVTTAADLTYGPINVSAASTNGDCSGDPFPVP